MRALAALAVAAVAMVAPASASACSCAPVDGDEAMRYSDGAVVAKLLEVTRHGRVADFRYRIEEAFKARRRLRVGRQLTIRASADSAACGLPHSKRGSYGLFLDRLDRRWVAGLCDVVSPRTMREAARGNGRRLGC